MVIKHLHRVGPVRRGLPNGRTLSLWSQADDWVSNQIYWRGWDGYEPESVPLFFRLAARSRVTFDVGAYVGFFSLVAAHANDEGVVYAFEPMADVFERLRKNVALNRLNNVRCTATAVGEIDGAAEFYHTGDFLPCSSSLSFEFMQSAGAVRSSVVPVITLDRFVQENGLSRIDLVKIDTESTEPQVLRGMIETVRRDHPIVMCEVLKDRGSERALEEILRPLGYRFYLLTPDGPVMRERIEGHPSWLNYLFTTLEPDEVSSL
jgi:FkbM family methyltransferase